MTLQIIASSKDTIHGLQRVQGVADVGRIHSVKGLFGCL